MVKKKVYVKYNDNFDQQRHLVWNRSRAQAKFREETWELTFEEFCKIWHSEELWQRRGRSIDCLCLTRYDETDSWNLKNCCLIDRYSHLIIKNRRQHDLSYEEYFQGAIFHDAHRL